MVETPQDFGIGQLFWGIREAVIVAAAATGSIVLWNPAAETIFGYRAEEVLGYSVDMLVPEELKQRHLVGLARYHATGHGPLVESDRALELPALHKSGRRLTIELSLVPVESASRPGRYVLAIIRDATERKRAEQEREGRIREHAARAEAEAAQRRFAFLAEASAVLGSSLDYEDTLAAVSRLSVPEIADWCIVYEALEERQIRPIGRSHRDPAKEALVEALSRPHLLDPADLHPAVRAVYTGRPQFHPQASVSLAGAVAGSDEQATLLHTLGFHSCICVPLKARGRTLGAAMLATADPSRQYTAADLALAEDLAGRAALAADNARLYQEAREAVRVRDEFFAAASHELRTPVTTIKAYAQVLHKRAVGKPVVDSTQLLDALQSIDDNSSRLAAQINELLDLSRLQSGRALELYRRPTDLVALIRKAVETQRLLSGRHEIRLQTPLSALVGNWDGFRLERVLHSLLSNAVKYSPAGGEIVADLKLEEGAAYRVAVLTVRDSGIGIPLEDQPHIFERFYRGSNVPARAYGAGVGLAALREIMRLHGGSIDINSAEGKGTTCTLRLPAGE